MKICGRRVRGAMGGNSSAPEADFALPQQQVVSVGPGSRGSRSAVGQQVRGASVAAAQASRCTAEEVKMPLAWTKDMTLHRAQSSRHLWELQAHFKTDVACELEVHFHCVESLTDSQLRYEPAGGSAPASFQRSYEAGVHTLALAGEAGIDLQTWPLNVFWQYTRMKPNIIPIALSLKTATGIQSVLHLSLAAVPDGLSSQVLRQKAVINGRDFVVEEIYGLAEMGDDDAHDENSLGSPCIICLCDPRTTAVLPCRHLCLCQDCAGAIRARGDRCPICRQEVTGIQTFQITH